MLASGKRAPVVLDPNRLPTAGDAVHLLYDHENLAPLSIKRAAAPICFDSVISTLSQNAAKFRANFYYREHPQSGPWRAPLNAGFHLVPVHEKGAGGSVGQPQANADVELTMHAARSDADAIWIATHDGSFTPLVRYLQDHGKKVYVLAYSLTGGTQGPLQSHRCASSLAIQADGVLLLKDIPSAFYA